MQIKRFSNLHLLDYWSEINAQTAHKALISRKGTNRGVLRALISRKGTSWNEQGTIISREDTSREGDRADIIRRKGTNGRGNQSPCQ